MRLVLAVLALVLVGASASAGDVDVDVVVVGAGYAGLAAAYRLEQQNFSVHVLEATDHAGGRTRNFDLASGAFDTASDAVVEVGGTFVAPGHTALIALAKEMGHDVYNVSGHGSQRRPSGGGLARARVGSPPGEWPWWWWGVDTTSKLEASVFHTASGRHTFTAPADIRPMFDEQTWAELEAAGQLLQQETAQIECQQDTVTNTTVDNTGTAGYGSCDGSAWFRKDSQTFEGWMAQHLRQPQAKSVLRNMCRGMIAQEPAAVSFLSILKSLKGCWSAGAEDQYRIRGGTQAVPLSLAVHLGRSPRANVTLSSPVRSIEVGMGAGTGVGADVRVLTVRSDRMALRARYAVVTGPPSLAGAIQFEPASALGHAQAQLLQRMPMGTSMKYFVQYDRAWWRQAGWSGAVMSSWFRRAPPGPGPGPGPGRDPLTWGDAHFDACMEHSPYDGTVHAALNASHFALMCWVEGETNLRFYASLNESQRRDAVLGFLERSFNDTRARTLATRVVAHNWADQAFARGAYTGYFTPGVQSQPELWRAFSALSNAPSGGLAPSVWLAGADYQLGFGNGYIEGAIRSGYAAAAAVRKAKTQQEARISRGINSSNSERNVE